MAASALFFVALHGPIVAGIASGELVRNLGNEFPSFAGVMAGAHVGYVVLLRMVSLSRAEHLLTAQRMQLMAELASTDVLTTLLNRRATAEALAQAVALSQRHGTPLSVALIDIDHFKRVNDHHGHAAGDRVLAETAQRLRRGLRTEDTLGRWGGEEFLLVLPQTALEGAMSLAGRLREVLASDAFPHGEPVTVSIGVTQVGVGDDPHVAIARADRALYRAKAMGRNRVESCEASGS
jgi:diguanylate cyclase (GGDEF)-like protein